MRIDTYKFPKSSFLSIEKDLNILTGLFLKNERLKKLLYYTTSDALKQPTLTDEQTYELFGKNIKIVPKLFVDDSTLNYIVINFNNFSPNATNPEFRDNIIFFNIVCHYDQWRLGDFKLRPYLIAAEIDSMLDAQRLSGIGQVDFLGANQIVVNNEFAGISLMYSVIHGEEDKKNPENPKDEIDLIDNFNEIFN